MSEDLVLAEMKIESLIQQNMQPIIHLFQCPDCNHLHNDLEIANKSKSCLNCDISDNTPEVITPSGYFPTIGRHWSVPKAIAEYSLSDNKSDHISAVLMFCGLAESVVEELVRLKADSIEQEVSEEAIESGDFKFKDAFNTGLRNYVQELETRDYGYLLNKYDELYQKRKQFIHGTTSEPIKRKDANHSVNLIGLLVNLYADIYNQEFIN